MCPDRYDSVDSMDSTSSVRGRELIFESSDYYSKGAAVSWLEQNKRFGQYVEHPTEGVAP